MAKDHSPAALRRADVRRCGTLWVAEAGVLSEHPTTPPGVSIRAVREGDAEAVRRAMVAAGADHPRLGLVRIQGKRLGYVAVAESAETWGGAVGEALAYGWVARPGDTINDLGFDLALPRGAAWVYDCATVPAHRGKGLYTALLRAMRGDFPRYGIRHGWIGTAPQNWASQRGIARAGFLKVADMDWDGPRVTAYGVPGVSPGTLRLASSSLGDGPDTLVLPGAGIPVIEGEWAHDAGDAYAGGVMPTDLMLFRAKYGEQIAWHDASGGERGKESVTLRSQGRTVALSAKAEFAALVDALESIAPGIPWLDTEL